MSWQLDVRMALGTLELEVSLRGEAGPTLLIGPNGAGKSTLLRTIAGAHRPEAGRIEVAGQVLLDTDRAISLPPQDRGIGYLPQGHGLFPHLDVLDNVAFGPGPAAPRRARALAMLAELGAEELLRLPVHSLSGGQRQRVALARALARRPSWLLLDEPMAALDASARRRLRGWLSDELHTRAVPSLLVTHDVRDVLALQAPVVVLEQGRVVQQGRAEALAAAPASDFVADFFSR